MIAGLFCGLGIFLRRDFEGRVRPPHRRRPICPSSARSTGRRFGSPFPPYPPVIEDSLPRSRCLFRGSVRFDEPLRLMGLSRAWTSSAVASQHQRLTHASHGVSRQRRACQDRFPCLTCRIQTYCCCPCTLGLSLLWIRSQAKEFEEGAVPVEGRRAAGGRGGGSRY